jgi:hypothetical protein
VLLILILLTGAIMGDKISFKDGIGNIPAKNNLNVFNKFNFCLVKSAISAELRDFITQYALFDEMQNFQAEKNMFDGYLNAQVPDAHSKYADPAMEALLLQLQPILEENTGLKLFPTYSYFRVYRNGDSLAPHRDRPACEISATICFNFNYNDPSYTWPIYIENTRISMDPGDMVIYKGCDLNHWRDELQVDDNSWHVQGFFHFVDQQGPYTSEKFDKRDTIGAPMITNNTPATVENKSVSGKKSYIQYT